MSLPTPTGVGSKWNKRSGIEKKKNKTDPWYQFGTADTSLTGPGLAGTSQRDRRQLSALRCCRLAEETGLSAAPCWGLCVNAPFRQNGRNKVETVKHTFVLITLSYLTQHIILPSCI